MAIPLLAQTPEYVKSKITAILHMRTNISGKFGVVSAFL